MTTPNISVVILAGGESKRMGPDKALLKYKGNEFIKLISSEMSKVSDEVIFAVGKKDPASFASVLGSGVMIIKDQRYLGNPMGA
jgi:molybdopterin-guanine dinucleotide biosynthesis protein A